MRSSAIRRFAFIGGIICLLTLSLPGCATPLQPTPTPEPVKIYFAFSAQDADYYGDLIEQFNEEHPAITVERKTARSRDSWEYLFEEKKVDAFAFSTFDDLFTQLYEEERLSSLSPLIRQDDSVDFDDFYPGVLEPFSIDGSVWAIPATIDLAVVYYNKDLFDQYGVAYLPFESTWDDLLQAAQQIRDPGEGVYGLVTHPFSTIAFVYQHGGRIFDDWQEPTRTTFDDSLTVEAIEWVAGLIHDHDVMPSPEEADRLYGQGGDAAYVFWRLKAGMYVDMLSARGGEAWGAGGEWRMEWGMVPMPVDQQASTLGFAQAFAILADTEYPDACWEWLMFLHEQIPAYSIPARKSLVESAAFEERVGGVVADVARASIENALIFSAAHAEFEQALNDYRETIYGISNGNMTASEALTELQWQVEAK